MQHRHYAPDLAGLSGSTSLEFVDARPKTATGKVQKCVPRAPSRPSAPDCAVSPNRASQRTNLSSPRKARRRSNATAQLRPCLTRAHPRRPPASHPRGAARNPRAASRSSASGTTRFVASARLFTQSTSCRSVSSGTSTPSSASLALTATGPLPLQARRLQSRAPRPSPPAAHSARAAARTRSTRISLFWN